MAARHAWLWSLVVPFAACADSAPPPDQAESAPATDPPQFETTEVAAGVYQFRFVGHNTLFVVTDAGFHSAIEDGTLDLLPEGTAADAVLDTSRARETNEEARRP